MSNKKIHYLFKTNTYTPESIKPIIKNIKNGVYEYKLFDIDGELIYTERDPDYVEYLYKNIEIVSFNNNTIKTKLFNTENSRVINHGITFWRIIYILFDDGKEFLLPSDYDRLMKYLNNEIDDEDYIDLNDILI